MGARGTDGKLGTMGVKDELKALVDDLSDDEAAAVLANLRPTAAGPSPEEQRELLARLRKALDAAGLGNPMETPQVADPASLRSLFESWQDEPAADEVGADFEERWIAMTESLDAERPHRPLFEEVRKEYYARKAASGRDSAAR